MRSIHLKLINKDKENKKKQILPKIIGEAGDILKLIDSAVDEFRFKSRSFSVSVSFRFLLALPPLLLLFWRRCRWSLIAIIRTCCRKRAMRSAVARWRSELIKHLVHVQSRQKHLCLCPRRSLIIPWLRHRVHFGAREFVAVVDDCSFPLLLLLLFWWCSCVNSEGGGGEASGELGGEAAGLGVGSRCWWWCCCCIWCNCGNSTFIPDMTVCFWWFGGVEMKKS